MGKNFEYEWWTVKIRFATGTVPCVYKGKNKESIIKQIEREVKRSNTPENLQTMRYMPIKEVFWDTLTFDRKGYQRLF